MVEISLELAAILCYTAFALFLSLYFVPFKVVPKAWAKAVQTKGHPAQLALDAVLEGAAPKVAKAIVVPSFALPKTTNGKTIVEVVEQLSNNFDAVLPIVKNLGDEAYLEERMRNAYGKVQAAERARAGIGQPGAMKELEEVVAEGGQALEHPEAAAAYKGLLGLIDLAETLAPETEASVRKYEKARRQAEKLYAQGGDMIALRDQFARAFPTAAAQYGIGAGGGVPHASGRGANF